MISKGINYLKIQLQGDDVAQCFTTTCNARTLNNTDWSPAYSAYDPAPSQGSKRKFCNYLDPCYPHGRLK